MVARRLIPALAGALAMLLSAPARPQPAAPCLDEIAPLARAACIGAEADRLLHDLDTRLAALTAGATGARPASLRAFEQALARDQREWRRALETRCREAEDAAGRATALAREACRLAGAEDRAARLVRVIAEARAANGIAAPPPPDCRVYLDQPPGRPPRPARARPRIECDLPGLEPATAWPGR